MRESCLGVLRRLTYRRLPCKRGQLSQCAASRRGGLLLNGCRACGGHEPSAIRVNCVINEDECGSDIFRLTPRLGRYCPGAQSTADLVFIEDFRLDAFISSPSPCPGVRLRWFSLMLYGSLCSL
ncbi:hypothetical protein CDAR_191161 [Caerostris darwini]|uniref:Uncharacterized protein n=1 Tax=Caerostris darwini TaxID=1538125 RepID=A0AAV4T1P6_9ARAC|nr:hypothetical protein CDAR_191161 [Caerostris darwini]